MRFGDHHDLVCSTDPSQARADVFARQETLATMACGLPYTNRGAGGLPEPDVRQPLWATAAFLMLMAELATAAKYKLPIKIVVIKNNVLGQIKWEQMVFLGNPEYGVDLYPIDFVKVAEACGCRAFHIEDAATCGQTLDEALATPGPVLIEALVDAFEPPMPAKVEPKQALNFAKSLLRGEPNARPK